MTKRENELLRILEDKNHGSAKILEKLNQHLLKYSSDSDYIEYVIIRIKKLFHQFSLIQNYLKDLRNVLDKNNSKILRDFLVDTRKLESRTYKKIFVNLQKIIPNGNTFMTISHSKTILEVLKLWKLNSNKLKVIVCESRPGLEGRILVKELLKQGIKVEIITDAMMPLKVPKVDAVLLGADQILVNGNVVNKTGSNAISIVAKHYSIPVYILAAKKKVVIRKKLEVIPDHNDQIWKYKHTNLQVSNNLFEEVEKNLITKIITD